MCRFIETLRIEGGQIYNVALHNRRLNRTLEANGIHLPCPIDLREAIRSVTFSGRTKCHVEYDAEGVETVACAAYHPRLVRSLRLLAADTLDYRFKYADRQALDALYERREGADDVLIVRDNLLTDTTIANVALFDGEQWWTPVRPLLAGTKRRSLLDRGLLSERDIPAGSIFSYRKICMLNAMLDFHEMEFDLSPATIIRL